MVEPWDWEKADLERLIQSAETETTSLEFKACDALGRPDAKREELSRDVSSLANAAGGAIVYGIVEQNHVAASLDTGYNPADVGKEWIEQVINSRVKPRIPGVRVKLVDLGGTPQKVAYVVYVPQGTTAHQANDGRFYRRYGTEKLRMEAHEIEDVMHRATSARLDTRFLIDGKTDGDAQFRQSSQHFVQSPSIQVVIANDSHAGISEFSQHQVFLLLNVKRSSSTGFRSSSTKVSGREGHLDYGAWVVQIGATDVPIFPAEERQILDFRFEVDSRWQHDRPSPIVLWRAWAARSAPSAGAVLFTRITDTQWEFKPVSIDELEDTGFSAMFGP